MELNKICLDMLITLSLREDFIRIDEFADKYNLTDRAIRYNIDKIESFLVKNGFGYIERQYNKGVKINRTEELDDFIKEYIKDYNPYKYSYSRDERLYYIVTRLLQNDEPEKVEYFEKYFGISKNTVLKEIDIADEWFKKRDLILYRKPRVGLYVAGHESAKRKALIEAISNTVSPKDIVSYVNYKTTLSKINNIQLETLFSNLDVDFINSLILFAEPELNREFNDDAYGSIFTHIAIMIKRIQLDKEIYIPEIIIDEEENKDEYRVAFEIVGRIEEKYSIKVPDEEIKYIVLHLLGAKVIKDDSKIIEEDYRGLYNVAKTMTDEIESIYKVDFKDRKEKIIEGLLIHLRPTIYRIKYDLKLVNPLYDQIRINYRELFINTKFVVRHLEKYIGQKVDEQEISYISLHFGAALLNMEQNLDPKAIIVCGTGFGTANMLASRLKSEFNVDIVDTISSRMIDRINTSSVDYIISTIDIPELKETEYIKVNPLLLNSDYELLKDKLRPKLKGEKKYESIVQKAEKLLNIVDKYQVLKEREQVRYEFISVLVDDEISFNNLGGGIYMLHDLLTREFIKTDVDVSTWQEAVDEGIRPLIEKGCVDERYKDAIINLFNELGPYMVVAPGIVLLHARPENGVKKISMSLITLKKPVNFGSSVNDPVKLVITLAAIDNESHLNALGKLMELLMSEDLPQIMDAKDKEEIIKIIKKYSN